MTITNILEDENKSFPKDQKPIKEKMDINVPLIIADNILKKMV